MKRIKTVDPNLTDVLGILAMRHQPLGIPMSDGYPGTRVTLASRGLHQCLGLLFSFASHHWCGSGDLAAFWHNCGNFAVLAWPPAGAGPHRMKYHSQSVLYFSHADTTGSCLVLSGRSTALQLVCGAVPEIWLHSGAKAAISASFWLRISTAQ
eukprot:3938341-Rhodomonas_salina.1